MQKLCPGIISAEWKYELSSDPLVGPQLEGSIGTSIRRCLTNGPSFGSTNVQDIRILLKLVFAITCILGCSTAQPPLQKDAVIWPIKGQGLDSFGADALSLCSNYAKEHYPEWGPAKRMIAVASAGRDYRVDFEPGRDGREGRVLTVSAFERVVRRQFNLKNQSPKLELSR